MKIIFACATLTLAIASAPASARGAQDFSWMSGAWVSEGKGDWVEEHWTHPRGGSLMGMNRSGNDEEVTGFEFMRIAPNADGTISFWASPSGKTAVGFKLVSAEPNQAVFENPSNDYPTRIVYRRVGETLHGMISGPNGKNPMMWTFKRPRPK